MAEPLHLTIATLEHGQWDALKDGRIRPEGIDPEFIRYLGGDKFPPMPLGVVL